MKLRKIVRIMRVIKTGLLIFEACWAHGCEARYREVKLTLDIKNYVSVVAGTKEQAFESKD